MAALKEQKIEINENTVLVLCPRKVGKFRTVDAHIHQRDALDEDVTHKIFLTADQMDRLCAAWGL